MLENLPEYVKLKNAYNPLHYPANKKIPAEEWNALWLATMYQGNHQEDVLASILNGTLPEIISNTNSLLTLTDIHSANIISLQTQITNNDTDISQLQTDVDIANNNANDAVSTANTANTNSETAVATANEAKETADNAESVALGIDAKASEALSNSETAVNTANEAKTAIASAVPNSRKVNNKALSEDIVLKTNDISDTDETNKWSTAEEKEKISKIVISGDGKKALLNDGTYGEVGTVDTVNNVLPDENKNITITAEDINYSEESSVKEKLDNLQNEVSTKQDELVSGVNIKTINNASLLGSGDIEISLNGIDYLKDHAKTYLVIKTPADNDTFTLLTGTSGSPNYTIEWGDGESETITTTDNPSHEYETAGMYLITISGSFENGIWFGPFTNANKDKIIEVYGGSNYPLGIKDNAFRDCTSLTTANFPNATSIGIEVFRDCTSLTTVNIPNATSIGGNAFWYSTSLTTVNFPSATDIGVSAFRDCTSLKELTLGNVTTTSTGTRFRNVKLINLTIAQEVTDTDIERILQFYADNGGTFIGNETKHGLQVEKTPTADLDVVRKVDLDTITADDIAYDEDNSVKDELDIKVNTADIINNLMSTDTNKPLSALQGKHLKDIIDTKNFGKAFNTISDMISDLNSASSTDYRTAFNLLVVALEVPDFWITEIMASSVAYTYTTDQALIDAVGISPVQIGYFKISKLETAKVDLSNYATKLSIPEWNVPVRAVGTGTGEPNSSLRVVAENPEAQTIVRRRDNGSVKFSDGQSNNEGATYGQAFKKVYKSLTDLTGIDASSTLAQLCDAMADNSYLNISTSGYANLVPTGETDLNGQLEIIKVNENRVRLAWSYQNASRQPIYFATHRNNGGFLGWKRLITDSENQRITGIKTFDADTAKFSISAANTDYRYPLTSPYSTSTEKRFLLGVPASQSRYTNYNLNVYMENDKLYSNGKEVATKQLISQWHVPYRDIAGNGEANTSRLATMTSPLPQAILIRDNEGKVTFVGGTSASQGIVKSQLDSAVANMVTTNTDQTITGQKSFTNTIIGTLYGNASTSTNTSRLKGVDTRNNNETPEWYISDGRGGTNRMSFLSEFKITSVLGLSGSSYCLVLTVVPWGDATGGLPSQTAYLSNGEVYMRKAESATVWGAWRRLATTAYVDNKLQTVSDEATAETQSLANPDNFYFYEEE